MSNDQKSQDYMPIGKEATVFQAEIVAISEASIRMTKMDINQLEINFYIDSQSAINAIGKYIIKDKTVLKQSND